LGTVCLRQNKKRYGFEVNHDGSGAFERLTVSNIHNKILINMDEVINIFSRSSRRIKMENWSI